MPAPVSDITISWQGQQKMLEALIDSGASGTIIPASLVDELNLRKIGETVVRGYDDRQETRNRYAIDVNFLGLIIRNFPVVSVPNRTYVLVGRDILNRRTTTLHGPQLEFTLT